MSSECLFCKMVAGEITPRVVFEDEHVLAFEDINPQAPVHFLVVPRQHIATVNALRPEQAAQVGQLYLAAAQVAAREGFAEAGYRTVMNCNADAGQSVFHIHLHVLAGKAMGWPPYP